MTRRIFFTLTFAAFAVPALAAAQTYQPPVMQYDPVTRQLQQVSQPYQNQYVASQPAQSVDMAQIQRIAVVVTIAFLIAWALFALALLFGAFKKPHSFARDSVFAKGWELERKYPWRNAGALVAFQVATILFSLALRYVPVSPQYWGVLANVSLVLNSLFFLIAGFILIRYYHAMYVDRPISVLTMLPSARQILFFLVACLLYVLSVLAGLFFFFVPAAIFAVSLVFFPLIILEKGVSPMQALRMSAELTKGSRLDLFFLLVLLLGVNIVGALVGFVMGLLVTIPLSCFILIGAYRDLSENAGNRDSHDLVGSEKELGSSV